jgi:hypothetical protein
MKNASFIVVLCIAVFSATSCTKDTAVPKTLIASYNGVKSNKELLALLNTNVAPFNKLSTTTVNALVQNAIFDKNQMFHGFAGASDFGKLLTPSEIVDFYTKVCGQNATVVDENGNSIIGTSDMKTLTITPDNQKPPVTHVGFIWNGVDCSTPNYSATCITY